MSEKTPLSSQPGFLSATYKGHEGIIKYETLSVTGKSAVADFVPNDVKIRKNKEFQGIPCKDLIVINGEHHKLWAEIRHLRGQINCLKKKKQKKQLSRSQTSVYRPQHPR